jgi:hypothetical protein
LALQLLTKQLPWPKSDPYAAVSRDGRATSSANPLAAHSLGGCAMGDAAKNLRDELAGQALGGLLAGPNAPKRSKSESVQQYALRVAEEAYLYADAMLRKREQSPAGEAAEAPPPVAVPPQKARRPGTVRISGNWRNPNKMEWAGAPAVDAAGHIDRGLAIPEEVYQVIEREMANGNVEGITFLSDGARVDWFVDR